MITGIAPSTKQPRRPLLRSAAAIVAICLSSSLLGPPAAHAAKRVDQAKQKVAAAHIHNFITALEMYYLDNAFYPTTDQGLQALVKAPTIPPIPQAYPPGGYVTQIPQDPWNHDYVYQSPAPNGFYLVISYGADGKPGGTGENADITSENVREKAGVK